MRLRTVFRTLLVGLLSLSIFGLQSPADAETAGALVFQGTAVTSPLGLPGPDDVPDGVLDPLTFGPSGTWSFESTQCVDVGVNVDKPGKDPAQAGNQCSIGAGGVLQGWCGRSHGSSAGGDPDVYVDSLGQSYTLVFKWTSAGGTLVVTGTATKTSTGQTGDLNAVVQATPTVGSCAAGTATGFLVTGLASAVVE